MKKFEFYDDLERSIPEASPLFGKAVRDTLADLARCEAEKEETAPMKPVLTKRRTLTFVLAAILLIAAVATAATLLSRNVFEVTMGVTPENAGSLTQHDLAKETIGHAEITIKEAAYDGMSLYIVYSIRDTTATERLGQPDETGMWLLREEDYQYIHDLGVGWWSDNLWIDGKSVDMPSMSGGMDLPGEQPGEMLSYMQYRLDQVDLYLTGTNVEVSMPIGPRQPREELVFTDEGMEKPKAGLVSFHMDCSSRDQVTVENPNIVAKTPQFSAQVSEVVYSPIQMYVTVNWAVDPDVMAAYIAENGDGYYDENGVKYWDYGGQEVCGPTIMSMTLVDETGKPVFENMQGFYGCGGAGDTIAWYTFPYAEKYPDKMFLAPDMGGQVDMSLAIQLR